MRIHTGVLGHSDSRGGKSNLPPWQLLSRQRILWATQRNACELLIALEGPLGGFAKCYHPFESFTWDLESTFILKVPGGRGRGRGGGTRQTGVPGENPDSLPDNRYHMFCPTTGIEPSPSNIGDKRAASDPVSCRRPKHQVGLSI